jgi:hypothetical protein
MYRPPNFAKAVTLFGICCTCSQVSPPSKEVLERPIESCIFGETPETSETVSSAQKQDTLSVG